MKKGIVIGLLAAFSMFAAGASYAAIGADGKLTVDKPEAVWGKAKSKGPVTFNHNKHGKDLGCVTCHHQDKELKEGGTPAKLCFDCHGAEAKDKQATAKDIKTDRSHVVL